MVKVIKKAQPKRRHSSAPKRRKVSLWVIVVRVVLFVAAAALCVSYLSMFVSPRILWLPFFFGLYYIPLALVNIVFMLIALCRRSVAFLIPALALIPSVFFADEFVKFGSEPVEVSSENIRVLTYNVGRFAAGPDDLNRSDNQDAMMRFVSEVNADVVCLQEVQTRDTLLISKVLPQYPYCYHHLRHGGDVYYGNVTFSRLPIVGAESCTFIGSTNMFLYTDVKAGARVVRIFNCHLESYGISFTSLIKKLSDKEYFTDEIVQLHEHLRGGCLKRTEQVDTLASLCQASAYPTMICGDFNDTPVSYAYHHLLEGHKDAFVEAGSGLSSSYSVLWPLLRIDYVLVPQEYRAVEYKVVRVPYSDHYPVVSAICFD